MKKLFEYHDISIQMFSWIIFKIAIVSSNITVIREIKCIGSMGNFVYKKAFGKSLEYTNSTIIIEYYSTDWKICWKNNSSFSQIHKLRFIWKASIFSDHFYRNHCLCFSLVCRFINYCPHASSNHTWRWLKSPISFQIIK